MGSMSASDAAPLPRLGEVFFDVRGSSRSMRLSWYADTGVSVFSIWQGGTCTGTFRLPLDELSRMVESLSRGLADGPVQVTGDPGATGPIALGGQQTRLAIGAAPLEAFTGAMAPGLVDVVPPTVRDSFLHLFVDGSHDPTRNANHERRWICT